MKNLFIVLTIGLGSPCFAKVCDSFTETEKLQDIQTGIVACDQSDGEFIVKLPAKFSYKLYKRGLGTGDYCEVTSTRNGANKIVTVSVSLPADSDEDCRLHMFDPKDKRNHADMTIETGIGS